MHVFQPFLGKIWRNSLDCTITRLRHLNRFKNMHVYYLFSKFQMYYCVNLKSYKYEPQFTEISGLKNELFKIRHTLISNDYTIYFYDNKFYLHQIRLFCIISTHFCEKNSKNGPKFPINPKSSILVRSLRTLRPTGYFSRSSDFVFKKIIEIPSKNTLLLELFEIQTDFLKIVVHKNFRIQRF